MGGQVNFKDLVQQAAGMGVERVDTGTVFNAVDRIKKRFNVSDGAVERAMSSQVWVVDRETFEQYTEIYLKSIGMDVEESLKKYEGPKEIAEVLGVDVDNVNKERALKLEEVRLHISANQGISLPLESGGALILINRDDCEDIDMAITHELVHAMMDENPGNYENVNKCKRGGFEGRGLNEATVQLITLCSLYPEKKVLDILRDIKDKRMITPYAKEIRILDMLLWGTTLSEEGGTVNFESVVGMYFDEEKSPGEKKWLLKINIARGLPEKVLDRVNFRDDGLKLFDSIC